MSLEPRQQAQPLSPPPYSCSHSPAHPGAPAPVPLPTPTRPHPQAPLPVTAVTAPTTLPTLPFTQALYSQDLPPSSILLLFDLNGTLSANTGARRQGKTDKLRPGLQHLVRLREHGFRWVGFQTYLVESSSESVQVAQLLRTV